MPLPGLAAAFSVSAAPGDLPFLLGEPLMFRLPTLLLK